VRSSTSAFLLSSGGARIGDPAIVSAQVLGAKRAATPGSKSPLAPGTRSGRWRFFYTAATKHFHLEVAKVSPVYQIAKANLLGGSLGPWPENSRRASRFKSAMNESLSPQLPIC
jgi:hypothetical protein